MSTLDMEELTAEKTKLEGDRTVLVENLQKLRQQSEQVQSQISAIGGAIQTCDYFIGKLQQSSQDSEPDGERENEDETT
tara:strand:+ start:261 stop:497 length:237 start_codon:yes stop_codon:yes gene_type:complete